jgi:hypothetical protein
MKKKIIVALLLPLPLLLSLWPRSVLLQLVFGAGMIQNCLKG